MGELLRSLRLLPPTTIRALRGRDLLLLAGGLTFYAAIAALPLLLVSTWLATRLVGPEDMARLGDSLAAALPDQSGGGDAARWLIQLGSGLQPAAVIFGVFAGSLYGEGLRRAYRAIIAAPSDRLLGWRGRLSVLPILGITPLLLLVLLGASPLLARLFGQGPSGVALAVFIALVVDWLVLTLPMAWSFRVTAPAQLPWRAALIGGSATASFVAGFLQGFVLFLAIPLDLGAPFAGSAVSGGIIAVLLWLWVLHLVILVGFAAITAGTRLAGARVLASGAAVHG